MLPENDEILFPIPLFHKAKLYTSYTDGPFGKRILHLAGRESYKMASFTTWASLLLIQGRVAYKNLNSQRGVINSGYSLSQNHILCPVILSQKGSDCLSSRLCP